MERKNMGTQKYTRTTYIPGAGSPRCLRNQGGKKLDMMSVDTACLRCRRQHKSTDNGPPPREPTLVEKNDGVMGAKNSTSIDCALMVFHVPRACRVECVYKYSDENRQSKLQQGDAFPEC